MIGVAVGVVLFVVVAGAAWARIAAARMERRSVEGYERTLDVLGDVAKRSDAVAEVHAPAESELARPHVNAAGDFPAPAPSAIRILPPARVRLEPPVLPGQPGRMPVFGDADLVTEGATGAVVDGAVLEPRRPGAGEPQPVESQPQAPGPVEHVAAEPAQTGAATASAAAQPPPADAPASASQEPLTIAVPVVPVTFGPELPTSTAADPATELVEAVTASDVTSSAATANGADGGSALGDAGDGGEGVAVFDFDDVGDADGPVPLPKRRELARLARPSDHRSVRRAATGAAAAAVVGAIAVGGWQLASRGGGGPSQSTTTSTLAPANAKGAGKQHAATPTTTVPAAPARLEPTSTSSTLVTYAAPSGPYTVSFTAVGGTCWLGAQAHVNTSAYLQMWTLTSGEHATYRATGPLVVKIGAPHYVKITVNGKPVDLPSGNVQAYDISFQASSGTNV